MTDRSPEQHMADVAAATLETISRLLPDARTLRAQLEILAGCARDLDRPLPDRLMLACAAGMIFEDTAEAVRDIASTLPLRGIDYGIAPES
jgi:hypothetical protein